MLHFEGDKDFPQAPAELWSKLSDARFLAESIPDVQSVTQAEAQAAALTVRPGFSFVRGTLDVTLRVAEPVEASSVRLLAHSKGIGSSSDVEATLKFAPQGGGTQVHWVVEVKQLGGLLKAVPQGLIKASAQKVIGDVWASVEKRLGAGA
jgi:carbon monoxide dehydrogenase subunit G